MKKQLIFMMLGLFLVGFVLAIPTYPHAFYGTAKFTNGTNISDGYIITGEVNGVTSGSCVIYNGKYDLVVTDTTNGGQVKFYIQGEKADQTSIFKMFEITELNITIKSAPEAFGGCGDGICGDVETCSTCPVDCGSCPSNNDGSSDGGGGGGSSGGSGGIISQPPTNDSASGPEGNTTQISETEEQGAGPGITGGVIGFLKSGEGIVSLITFILIIILLIGVVLLKKKSPKNE